MSKPPFNEPWNAKEGNGIGYIEDCNGEQITGSEGIQFELAERIVSCVNACVGFQSAHLDKVSRGEAGFHIE